MKVSVRIGGGRSDAALGHGIPIARSLFSQARRTMLDVRALFLKQGLEPLKASPAEFGAFVQDELAKNAALVKQIGLKPE